MPVAAAGISAAMAVVTAGKMPACMTTAHMAATHVTATAVTTATMAAAAASICNGRSQRQRQHRSTREKDVSYGLSHVYFLEKIISYVIAMAERPVRS
ncbi:hypothetical protein [Methylovirgula ligni]|uniref:hypothetical protein n=1 Tax=Methylovirgula ligni TaxID=569860 RepID=UPI001AEC7E50|nr:hypothetical protein [Methylovirgula ligni]